MKPFHIACGSPELSILTVARKNRLINFDVCNNCHKIIESYDIQRVQPMRRSLSLIRVNKEMRNMINLAIERSKTIHR